MDTVPNTAARAIVMQKKTERPVQCEITEQTTDAIAAWITAAHLKPEQFLFPSRVSEPPHLLTRQYSRIVGSWVECIGLGPVAYGTHSLRRTKATLVYRRTRNLRAVQLLLGHTKLESTVRYLGIEVDDALEILCLMDMAPLILIRTPIMLPAVTALGVDPVHFGMIMLLNLGIGLLTPPVGATLFVGCAVGKVSMEDVMREIWPFYAVMFAVLMLVTYVPMISLWLPHPLKL
jgi:hypothetical protein